MAIARWYATKYNAIVGQVPRTTPVRFLKMWAYRLVSRADDSGSSVHVYIYYIHMHIQICLYVYIYIYL